MLHDGKCARLHGHSWTGYVEFKGEVLQPSGPQKNMLADYYHMGKICKAIEERFDHQHLNDILETDMPTSEFVAKYIYEKIACVPSDLVGKVVLERIVINETCSSQCTYEP